MNRKTSTEHLTVLPKAKRGRPSRGLTDGNEFKMACTQRFLDRLDELRFADPAQDLSKADVVRKLVEHAHRRIEQGLPWLD